MNKTFKNWFFRRKQVFSNIPLYGIPYTFITDIEQFDIISDGFCLFDELWNVCVHPDTNIITPNNIQNAGDCNSNPFLSIDLDNLNFNSSSSIGKSVNFIAPDEKLIHLSTRTREITTSKNHKFFLINRDPNFFNRHKNADISKFVKEKEAKDIRKNDRVLIASKLPEPKDELISKEKAQLIGYIAGDGNIECPHRHTIHIDDSSLSCIETYQKIAEDLGFSTSIKKHKDKNCYRLRLFGKKMIEKMLDEIKDVVVPLVKTSKIVNVPERVIKSNNNVLSAFIRGFLDAEGCIFYEKKFKSPKIRFYNTNRKMLEKLKMLMLRFGIDCSNIKEKDNNRGYVKKKGNCKIYMMDISDNLSLNIFKEQISFSHPDKKKRMDSFHIEKRDTKRKIYGDVEIGYVTEIKEIPSNVPFLIDFTVPIYGNYVANGFIVHNCDSRMSLKKKNSFVSRVLGKSRKRHLNISFTAQMVDQLDKRVRKICDFTSYPILSSNEEICFKAETPIICNPEIKTIESINIGDKVLTHTGRFKQVKEKFERDYNGDMYKICPKYLKFPVEMTANHPILIAEPIFNSKEIGNNWEKNIEFLRNNFFSSSSKDIAKALGRTFGSVNNKKCDLRKTLDFGLVWKRADEICKNDLLAYPIIKETDDVKEIKISDYLDKVDFKLSDRNFIPPKEWKWGKKNYYIPKSWSKKYKGWVFEDGIWTNKRCDLKFKDIVKINDDFMKLAGYYVGDGSSNGHQSNIYLNESEGDKENEVKMLVKKVFGIECSTYKITTERVIRIGGKPIADFLQSLFGKYAWKKKVPQWFMTLPKEKLVPFIEGLVASDGHIKNNSNKSKSIVTTSELLSSQVINMILRLRKRFNMHIVEPKKNDKITSRRKSYVISFDHTFSKNNLFYLNDYILYPIDSIEKNHFKGKVYNFEVDEDNSYVTKSVTAHNCKVNVFRTGYPKDSNFIKTFWYRTAKIFNAYDTDYIVEMGEEEEKDAEGNLVPVVQPPIYFQESKESERFEFKTWEEADKMGEAFWTKRQSWLKEIF